MGPWAEATELGWGPSGWAGLWMLRGPRLGNPWAVHPQAGDSGWGAQAGGTLGWARLLNANIMLFYLKIF